MLLIIVINKIQEFLYTFVANKSFGQLLSISPENLIFLKTQNFHILMYGLRIYILNN